MSQLGHERPFCDVCGTSALPPILTVTADILNRQLRAITGREQVHKNPRSIDRVNLKQVLGDIHDDRKNQRSNKGIFRPIPQTTVVATIGSVAPVLAALGKSLISLTSFRV